MRNDNDPLLTFEGDNNVLLQQTSNNLISAYGDFLKTRVIYETPLKTTVILKRFDEIMNSKFSATNRRDLMNSTSKN